MSATRPAARSLLSRRCLAIAPPTRTAGGSPSAPQLTQPPTSAACRHFHGSAALAARRKPRFKNLGAAQMGLIKPLKPDTMDKLTAKKFPEYSELDKQKLGMRYSKEQMESLAAGEVANDPEDFARQGRLRMDPYQLGYVDDLSTIQPILDKRARTKGPPDIKATFMSPDEFTDDIIEWLQSFVPKDIDMASLSEEQVQDVVQKYAPSNLEILKYLTERSSMTDGGKGSNSALAPALMKKVPGVAGLYRVADKDSTGEDDDPEGDYDDIKKIMGVSVRQLKEVKHKAIVVNSVSNQTRLGKIQSFLVMTVAGNMDGRLGLGMAKSTELATATLKSRIAAIKNMVPIRRFEDRTIYGNVTAKVSGTVVKMYSRPPGFGLRVSHRLFEMARICGIRDLSARIPRSRNPMNTVKAAYQCLTNQPDPEVIAIGRGKKLADARKVYYGGAVY